jgi:glycosyltransferase involved in cell wall biosynthesis
VHDLIPRIFPNYLNNSRKRIYQDFVEKAIKKATKIITVSHHSEKDLINFLKIGAEKISVVYNDVDPIYKKEVTAEESKRVLKKYKIKKGYIYNGGGFEIRKNTETVLRAYWHLVVGNTSAKILKIPHLVISGKLVPELAPLAFDGEKLVKELGIENLVHFIGFAEQKDMPALYANAAMFVYPSFYEGFGLPILEAMSQGTPTIASKKTSLPEVGADSVLYCDASDYKDLAMVMKNILKNDHLKIALSLKGKERSKRFSWDVFATKTLNIISMMLKEK